jgi:hypothetical protein
MRRTATIYGTLTALAVSACIDEPAPGTSEVPADPIAFELHAAMAARATTRPAGADGSGAGEYWVVVSAPQGDPPGGAREWRFGGASGDTCTIARADQVLEELQFRSPRYAQITAQGLLAGTGVALLWMWPAPQIAPLMAALLLISSGPGLAIGTVNLAQEYGRWQESRHLLQTSTAATRLAVCAAETAAECTTSMVPRAFMTALQEAVERSGEPCPAG